MARVLEPGEGSIGPRSLGLPLLLLLVSAFLAYSVFGHKPASGDFLIGDCPYYASAAVSLWTDGDLDLTNQLKGGLPIHQKQVALGSRGEWYPKHPVFMSILSVPFYALFGVTGFLIFNFLVILLLSTVMWSLCRLYVSRGVATSATMLILLGSFLRAYAYNFSPDLFGTLLVLSAMLLILKRRNAAGGGLLGLSGLAKVTNILVSALLIAFLCFRKPRSDAFRAAAGMIPGIVAWVVLNLAMFGSPTTTGYDRTLVLHDGAAATVSHKGFFDLSPLEGMRGQLFDPRVGLLTTSPLLLLALPGLIPLVQRHPWESLVFIGLSEFIFLLFSTYRWWATSHYGNRFLMIPVCLAAVPMAFSLRSAAEGLRKAFGATRIATSPSGWR